MPKSKSLLIIEDDPDLRMTLEYFLGKIGYEVLSAKNCEEGLKKLAEKHPRAVLCDIMLPGTDGYEACKKIKADPTTRDTKVIFISARDSSEIERKGAEAGADYYISKPVDPNDVGADLYYLFEQDFHLGEGDRAKLRTTKEIRSISGHAHGHGHVHPHGHAHAPDHGPGRTPAHTAPSFDEFDDEFEPGLGGSLPKPQPVGTPSPTPLPRENLDLSPEAPSNMNLSEVHQLLLALRDSLKDTGQRLDAILQYIEVIEE